MPIHMRLVTIIHDLLRCCFEEAIIKAPIKSKSAKTSPPAGSSLLNKDPKPVKTAMISRTIAIVLMALNLMKVLY